MVYSDGTGALRAVLLGAMTSAWYEASDDDRRGRILPRFEQLVEEWRQIGAKVLATVDDDLLMVGEPRSTGYTFYVIVEVARLEDVVGMIQRIRESVDGVRMDQYVRFEARVGRPFFLLEPMQTPDRRRAPG
jgi:DNA-binding Lrp family transcriptional regulator